MSNKTWKRVVLKVGSALIAPEGDGCSSRYLLPIAHFIIKCRQRGTEVILVSSGSVAAGMNLVKSTGAERTIAMKKAMAASGQMEMMAAWDRLFDFPIAQLLLTQTDLQDHNRYKSITDTVNELLKNGIMPVINENDAVTTDDLKVGDNDNLSAMMAAAISADCLLICSDVDGLYTANPNTDANATLISSVEQITPAIKAMAGGAHTLVGTGGMATKIQAAEKAVAQGINTFIINGAKETTFNRLLNGENPGTHFMPAPEPLDDKQHWLTHTSRAQGEVVVKENIELSEQNQQQIGYDDVLAVSGEFAAGDTILIKSVSGQPLAKAQSRHSSCLLNFLVTEEVKAKQLSNTPLANNTLVKNELVMLETP